MALVRIPEKSRSRDDPERQLWFSKDQGVCTSQAPSLRRSDHAYSSSTQVQERERLMAQRASDRQTQHSKQIWTKDAHGGPYRKGNTDPDKSQEVEPGYERPKHGPTTNFVGNHMTQGAIDLVQMDLEEPDSAAHLQRLRHYCKHFRPPKLLHSTTPALLGASDQIAAPNEGQAPSDPAKPRLTALQICQPPSADAELQRVLTSDPARLRRALIHQRHHKKPGDGLLFGALPQPGTEKDQDSAPSASRSFPSSQGLQEAENAGREAMERGAYEEAVQCISAALTSPGVQDSSLQLHCLLLLVKCRTECGQHRQAIADCHEAILLARRGRERMQAELVSVLCARGNLYEQVEEYGRSMVDYCEALRMHPGHQKVLAGMQRAKAYANCIRDTSKSVRR